MTLAAGRMLDRYRIVDTLGAGGMGVVYIAEDTRLGRRVALKVLPPEVAGDPDRRARFEREARAVAALDHPNIVTLHSIEEADGLHFLTMELAPGTPLDRLLADGPLPLHRFFRIALPLTDALARAHAQGIVHRDVKTANVVVADDGTPKVLDFGLAKRVAEDEGDDLDSVSPTEMATRAGMVVGTPAYMAPEQLLGLPVDARTDVFSLGAVLFEMLSGRRPFERGSVAASRAALLREPPPALSSAESGVPGELARIVERCLAKEPDDRYPSAAALQADLERCRAWLESPSGGVWSSVRRPAVALPLAAVLVGTAALSGWWALRQADARRVRTETVPRIEALLEDFRHLEAYRLAVDARRRLPDDPTIEKLFQRTTLPFEITTDPPGAEVRLRGYRDDGGGWLFTGRTPLRERVPAGYLWFEVTLEGHRPVEGAYASWWGELNVELVPEGSAPEGMVRVPAGPFRLGAGDEVELPAHWIDRHEVTNREYQEFVDDGGYRRPELWPHPVVADGRELAFEEAMELFVDATARPGPATWSVGRHPDGAADLPVGGVSWYEAAAYAAWADKQLPTVYHWRQAAGQSVFADILTVSNFAGEGPAPVGSYPGLGPFGTLDMAGNVWEWCLNRVGDRRYALGGAWDEPPYTFADDNALPPLARPSNVGFRCMRSDAPPAPDVTGPIERTRFDFRTIEPMSDEMFELVAERYEYPAVPLEPRLAATGAGSELWRRESVSFEAASTGAERMLAHLFLPTGVEPPYQVVVYRPSSVVNWIDTVEDYLTSMPEYVPRSGRALVVPALYGTLERQGDGIRVPDRLVRQVQDLRRTVDYLETRDDLDLDRMAYVGLSAGGEYGPLYVALEPRFRAAVFLAGGFHDEHMLDEPRDQVPWNFAPRVTIPTLMVNGDNDFTLPLELAQRPMFELLGTPPEHKRHVIVAGGHVPFDESEVVREVLDWLDRYLGPVARGR